MRNFFILLLTCLISFSVFSNIDGADKIKSKLIDIFKFADYTGNTEVIHTIASDCLEQAKKLVSDENAEKIKEDIDLLISGIEEIIKESDQQVIKNKADELIKLIRA